MIDPNSTTWDVVRECAETAIAQAHALLEARGTPMPDTEFERGRIAAMREVLMLAKPRPKIPSTDPAY